MPRKRKSGLEFYWLENCRNCEKFTIIHFLENGTDNGLVSHKCKIENKDITPWKIDGCKHFSHGEAEVLFKDKEMK